MPPVPDEANVMRPGSRFASATKSSTELARDDAGTTKAIVPSATRATGAKSRGMSNGRLGFMWCTIAWLAMPLIRIV